MTRNRSPFGSILERAALYAEDSEGRRIPAVERAAIGRTVMPVHETPRHARSTPIEDGAEEQVIRAQELELAEREARREFDALSPRDHKILALHLHAGTPIMRTATVRAAEVPDRLAEGWEPRQCLSGGARVVMVRSYSQRLSQAEIARRVGVSTWTVRRALSRMSARMVALCEAREWILF